MFHSAAPSGAAEGSGGSMRVRGLCAAVAAALIVGMGCKSSSTEPEGPVIPSLPEVPAGAILLYDTFDNENGGQGANNWGDSPERQFTHWNVVSGCVDLHGNGFWDVLAGHGLYVDMDGSCWQAGTLESKSEFELVPGAYVLEFWIGGNQRNDNPDTLTVTVGNLLNEQFVTDRWDPFRMIQRRIDVAAPVSVRLRFQGHGGDQQGILLNLVRLRRAG
jgi:hypothetical protein